MSKVYCKDVSRLETKIFIFLRVFCVCVRTRVCMHVQAGLHIHICVSVLQSGIDFRQTIGEIM